MRRHALVFAVALTGAMPGVAVGASCTFSPIICAFTNEREFVNWASLFPGGLRLIDFERLPDGAPSYSGAQITANFNYTEQGVSFSAPFGPLTIGGTLGSYDLRAFDSDQLVREWIDASILRPTAAVGIHFGGGTTLYAADVTGAEIARVSFSAPGGPWFLGIVSQIPIATARVDRGSNSEAIGTFIFNPTPEPMTGALLALGAMAARQRRRFARATARNPWRGPASKTNGGIMCGCARCDGTCSYSPWP